MVIFNINLINCFFQAGDEELTGNEYHRYRVNQVQEMKNAGVAVYPHKFKVSISLNGFLETYNHLEKEQTNDVPVSVAGRVHSIRVSSQKLRFYDIRGEGVKLQVILIFL